MKHPEGHFFNLVIIVKIKEATPDTCCRKFGGNESAIKNRFEVLFDEGLDFFS